MDGSYEDVDELNDETFGCAEDGDWELEHERFALAHNNIEHVAPEADQLPKFWEASEDVSFLWQPEALDNYKSFFEDEGRERGVNVEETLQKLVSEDDTFEDPAILDISKKVSHQKLSGSALDKLLGAPAFPAAPSNLFNTSRDIWSSDEFNTSHRQPPNRAESNGSIKNASINLMDLLQQMAQTKGSTKNSYGEVPRRTHDVSVSGGSVQGIISEPRPISHSTISTKHTNYPIVSNRPGFGGSMHSMPGQSDFTDVAHQVSVTTSPRTLGMSQVDSSLAQMSNNFLQQQQIDTSQIRSLMETPTQSGNAIAAAITNYAQNSDPEFLRASALHMLLMQAQNVRLSGRGTATLPDPRYFQYMAPPGHGPAVPPPLIGPSRFVGTTPAAQSVQSPMFSIPLNPTTSMPFMMPHVTGLRSLPPNLLPLRPVQSGHAPAGNAQLNTRGNGPSGESVTSHMTVGTDEEFDPDKGSWMSEYESVGVLLMYLRPLMVSNPYVQDYYFAVRWLRRMTASRAKHMANGQVALGYPLPVMHMPSPVTLDHLSDSTHYQHTAARVKFVMPVASMPALAHRSHSPDSHSIAPEQHHEDKGQESASALALVAKGAAELKSSLKSPIHSSTENNSALGRPTRSNVYRPRVVVELSVASALSSDATSSCYQATGKEDAVPHATRVIKSTRWRRLLLARIERMYTLVLNLDEVDISLSRVVVQNETRNRLSQHRLELVQSLINELSSTSCQLISKQPTSEPVECAHNTSTIRASMLELFHVRKGIRLFGTVLHYLPQNLLRAYLLEFMKNYDEVCSLCGSLIEEFASHLYPNLRAAVYQIVDIAGFMVSCFPEGYNSGADVCETSKAVCALINSKLGLSLIFCLLDVCARLSKPEDPCNFIRFGAYFSLIATELPETMLPLESFPHLASILPVYVKPEAHPPLTSAGLDHFCRLIDPTLVSMTMPVHVGGTTNETNVNDGQKNGALQNGQSTSLTDPDTVISPLGKSVDDSANTKRTTMVAT